MEGGEGRQAKFLRLLGVKDKKGKGAAAAAAASNDSKAKPQPKAGTAAAAEEKKRAAVLAHQFEEGLKHRHHRHGGLGL